MNIVRKIHDLFRVKTLAGSTLQSPTSTSDSTGSGNTYITITGGSLGGGGLSEADRSKLNSIEQGAQVNLDAFSKVLLETTNRELEQLTTTSSSIIANIPSDTANIRLVGNYPIKVSLESVSLFNYNTVTTTGDIVASYNVSYNKDGNIVIDYVSGTLFSTTDIEIIRILHREETLATYNNTQFEYTESDGTITQFIIPYQGTDFSSILFCRYETSSSESTEGTETVRELSIITELLVSPTKQQIITLSDTNANYWKYEEDENGNRYLWTDCNVYSTKEVSAYGKAEEQEIPTILNLSLLQDVALTNLSNNLVLVYNASSQKWVNIDASNLGISADNLKTLTITINGTSYTYNPASSNQSISITTITLDDVLPYVSNKLDREEFFKWFTINYDSDNNVTSILANYDFYSIKGVSAYGLGDIGGITRTTLQSLDDVSLSNLVADNMLAYNGSKWVNIPMSQVRGVTSWADLENKPTTISGFGITDVYTKTEVNTKISEVSSKVTELSSSKADATIQVIAGDGLTGGGNLQQDITIALQNLNSTGTYYKVTVDTYGRVTSGISLLTIADILNLQTQLDSKLNIADFNTWFTIIYNTDGTIKNIRANYDFYSVGEVSAYGIGDEEKKNYTTLAELNDVQLTNVKETDVLVYNGTKWVNVDQSTIKGALSWADIQNKPTTISGFGIVDAYTKTEIDNKLSPINSSITSINSSINTINTNISDLSSSLSSVSTKLNNFLEGSDTDTIINKWKELESFLAGYTQTLTLADLLSVKANSSILIIAGTGLVGGGDLTANRTISLSTSGVSAGAYTKVTVDTYGRVTSGSTLSATDIPNLDWSKITSGKPTTLEGYGITDGVNSITITGSGNAITAVTISNHLLTFTKGETFLPKSTFDDLFEKVNVGTTDSPVYAIKAKYHLYSVGEVSAYEFGETGGTGVSSLEELIDVQLTNLVADSILKYNGSKWINIPITEVKGATSWDEIEDKPSTFTPSAHTHTVADITDISPLTLNVNGSSLFTYDGKSSITANLTVPTKVSQLTNDSGYLTAITKAQVEGVLTGNITSHTHDYLPLSGGTLTGALYMNTYIYGPAVGSNPRSRFGAELFFFNCARGNTSAYSFGLYQWVDEFQFTYRTSSDNVFKGTAFTIQGSDGQVAFTKTPKVGSTLVSLDGHTHAYLPLSGGTITGRLYIDEIDTTGRSGLIAYKPTDWTGVTSSQTGISVISTDTVIRSNDTSLVHYRHGKGLGVILDAFNYSSYVLPLSGGTMTGVITLTSGADTANSKTALSFIKSSDKSEQARIGTNVNNDFGLYANGSIYIRPNVTLGSNSSNGLVISSSSFTYNGTAVSLNGHTHSYLPLSGGAVTGTLYIDSISTIDGNGLIAYKPASWTGVASSQTGISAINTETIIRSNDTSLKHYRNGKGQGVILDTFNYNSYVPTLTGTGASGTWNINISGNAKTLANYFTSRPDTANISATANGSGGLCKFHATSSMIANKPASDGHILHLFWDTTGGYDSQLMIPDGFANYSPQWRTQNGGTWTNWVSFVTSSTIGNYNAGSATKLQTARTLWGQSFDGTANVSGALTGVTDLTASGTIRWNGSDGRYTKYTQDIVFYIQSRGGWAGGLTWRGTDGTFYNTIGHYKDYVYFGPGTYNAPTNYILDSNGYMGLGIRPTVRLHVAGDIAATGEVTAKASSSDIRLKTDISDYKALSIIRSHKSIKYHWNAVAKANADIFKDDYWHYGLIAQDVQRDMPQMVSDVFKDYLVINYERLIPICWKGLQEVDDEVTKLKKRVKQLEKRLLKYESTEVFYTKGND